MTRRAAGDTTTIRSSTGSRGRVVTSTMTRSSSRMSVTPPFAPGGAASTALVSSTVSPTFSSRIAAISSIVGLGIGRHQPWRCSCICVVPCRDDESSSLINSQFKEDFTTYSSVFSTHSSYRRRQNSLRDRIPDKITVLNRYMEDAFPLRSMAILREDPVRQLGVRTPRILCTRKQLSCAGWPLHRGDAMQGDRTYVRPASTLQADIRAKGGHR